MTDYYSLELPTTTELSGEDSPLLVTVDSPEWARAAAEKLGYYFKRELGTDFPPMEASEHPGTRGFITYEIYLFHEAAHDLFEEDAPACRRLFGACGLRHVTFANEHEPRWEMQWAWFHPFFRHRGHLAKAWPFLRQSYGDFLIQRPRRQICRHSSANTTCLARNRRLRRDP